ncbi:MAG TPA: PEP-CTERM sorting domain-containing protein [Methylomirabilota bacterium]|nr:PEP-CTERM sorting domain-containing protein [Methylomirabilota bacterium]
MRAIVHLLGALTATASSVFAFPTITGLSTPYTQDFDTLASSGSTGTTLPDGWAFYETGSAANASYGVGTGSSATGNTYSFGSAGATDRALGALRSGSLASVFGVQIRNSSGSILTALDIRYTGEQWRLGRQDRADQLDFQYSLDATSLTTGTWTDVNALDFVTPNPGATVGALDGNAAINQTALSFLLSGLHIPDGGTFWFRWVDPDAPSGADDGLAVDNFSVRGLTSNSSKVPESLPLSSSVAAFFVLAVVGGRWRRGVQR